MSTNNDIQAVSNSWDLISSSLQDLAWNEGATLPVAFKNAVEVLWANGISNIISEWYMEILKRELEENCVPRFWTLLQNEPTNNEINFSFVHAVNSLHSDMIRHNPALERLQLTSKFIANLSNDNSYKEIVFDAAKLHLRAILYAQIPLNYESFIQSFYSTAFKAFANSEKEAKNNLFCNVCNEKSTNCKCKTIIESFHTVNQKLYELGLLEQLVGKPVTSIISEHIENHVLSTCKGSFESSFIGMLEKWLDSTIVLWLVKVYRGNWDCNRYNNPLTLETVEKLKSRLHQLLYTTYAHTRMDQLFNIIIEFPESQPAIEDLVNCLEKTNLRTKLIQSLKETLETKLLHPGVNTADILTAYVSAIKALKILDSSGVILELVCEPVRKYLRTRHDTIKEIIYALIDDTSTDLTDELNRARPLVLEENYNSDDEMENWENWQPDPLDADSGKTALTRRTTDIISMLVNIYGSKEMFINEYRTLLADRIITTFNYDTCREIRYLELLKLKFGEANLHLCEVMLKDVADSRRINFHIHSDDVGIYQPQDCVVNGIIVSAQFWPTFREEKLALPDHIKASLDSYTKAFETHKGNRTLTWRPHLGSVNLTLEFNNRNLTLSVSPIHAVMIMQFEKKERWSIKELSAVMHVPPTVIRRKILFWQSRGILHEESRDVYVMSEENDDGVNFDMSTMLEDDDDEEESAMASSHDQREEELQVFWSYIVGMLTNLESLPLDRIHTMLRMFAMQGSTAVECSLQELRQFLDRKVREQSLYFSGGLYRLPRQNT
uniref:Anaphase-promoting complex subunit 2 n=1 Tax=Strigamia maritima TaxID=126957 RepID=T1IXP7_STRMM